MGSRADPPFSGRFSVPHAPAAPDVPTQRTRSQHGISKPQIRTDGTVRYDKLKPRFGGLTTTSEPSSLHEALSDTKWKMAMNDEYGALIKNKTWHLVPPIRNKNVIYCK